jgi:ribosomal protein S7
MKTIAECLADELMNAAKVCHCNAFVSSVL